MRIKYLVEIKQGNLVLEQNVDFIVNASNTRLVLGSGISMSFFRHCGHKLQIEMNELLTEIHSSGYLLKKGDAVPSSSGGADNFKHALHVATVDSNKGVHFMKKNPTLSTIDLALTNIERVLIEYVKLHNKKQVSLVLPLLGCGIGGLNKQDVIDKYDKFFTSNNGSETDIVCRIILYGYGSEDMPLLTNAFKKT